MSEILDDFTNEKPNPNGPKGRHGCVTAWLILMIVVNALTTISFFLLTETTEDILGSPSSALLWLIGGLSLFNVFFAVLLLQWKKIGFWGFVANAAILFFITFIIGLPIIQFLTGFISILILYGILQIKGNDQISAWNNME